MTKPGTAQAISRVHRSAAVIKDTPALIGAAPQDALPLRTQFDRANRFLHSDLMRYAVLAARRPRGHDLIGADTLPLQLPAIAHVLSPAHEHFESAICSGHRRQWFYRVHLVRLLVARGRPVSCFVRPTSHVKELVAAGARLVTGDVNDRAGVSRAIALSNARVVFACGVGCGDSPRRLHARERRGRRGGRGGVHRAGAAPGALAHFVARRCWALGRGAENRKRSAIAGLGLRAQQIRWRASGREYAGALPITIVRLVRRVRCRRPRDERISTPSLDPVSTSCTGTATGASRSLLWRTLSNASSSRRRTASALCPTARGAASTSPARKIFLMSSSASRSLTHSGKGCLVSFVSREG